MNKLGLKVVCIICMFSLTVAFFIGSVALRRSTDYLTAEIKGKITSTAENYSHNLSSQFNHMEGLTDSMSAYVATGFDKSAFENDPSAYLKKFKLQLAEMIQSTLKTTSMAHSLYVTFNPDLTPQNDEVWYAQQNGRITEISADFKSNKRNFSLPYNSDMAYFFKPQGQKKGTWTGPYYDKDLHKEVFSYSRAIYINGLFVGVAGADITGADTVGTISKMKLYDSGYSALLDTDLNFVVCPSIASSKENRSISQALKKVHNKPKKSGIVEYTFEGRHKILGFSALDNNWTFIVTQSKSDAFSPIHALTNIMIILGIILAAVLIAFLIVFSRPFIKKQHTLEQENQEKDIMLIYQSRQAKTGEMMGNITHQWKQPLNTINLILANLLDSYRFGDLTELRLQKSVSKVEKIVETMSETITDFSDFLKPSKEKLHFDIRDCVKSALSLMEESIKYHKILIGLSYTGNTICFGYPNELTHVIFNVLNNARDAIVDADPADRTIIIGSEEIKDTILITVKNFGSQLSEEDKAHLFEPYFTTKSKTGGTGLGLYISREIVEQRMSGHITLENTCEGVCCCIQLQSAKKK